MASVDLGHLLFHYALEAFCMKVKRIFLHLGMEVNYPYYNEKKVVLDEYCMVQALE